MTIGSYYFVALVAYAIGSTVALASALVLYLHWRRIASEALAAVRRRRARERWMTWES